MRHPILLFASFVLLVALAVPATAQLNRDQVLALLTDLDERQRALGDVKAMIYMEQKEKGKGDLVYEAITYRREKEGKLVFLFTKPKTEAGKGYLQIDKNLFIFDPAVGRWERRTQREQIGGTDSRRQDFDVRDLAVNYDAKYVATEKLGKYVVHHLALTAKEGASVAFPTMHLWLDEKTNNPLKQQDHAASGKLLRTLYFPKWEKVYSERKKEHLYFPRETRIYNEVEKGKQTTIVIREIALEDLDANVFTKGWVESKSR